MTVLFQTSRFDLNLKRFMIDVDIDYFEIEIILDEIYDEE